MQSPAPLTFLAATKRPHEHPMGLRSGPGPRMVQAVGGGRLDRGQVCPAAPLYYQVLTDPVLVEWGQTKTQTYRHTCLQACTCVLQHFITCTDTAATTVNYSIFPNKKKSCHGRVPTGPWQLHGTGIWGKLQQISQEYVDCSALPLF